MSDSKENYSIQKNSWPRFGRIGLLWKALAGWRLLYLAGLLALLGEVFFTFGSPVIVKLTIDSVIGTSAPSVPAPLSLVAEALLGPELEGGGLLKAPEAAPLAEGSSATEWVWRPWLRSHLWAMGIAFAFFILFQAFFSFLASFSVNVAAEHAAKALRDRLYGHVQDLPYEAMLRSQTGDWLQRCTSDVDTTRRFIAFEFVEMFRTLALASFAFPVMVSLSPRLTLWGVVVMPVIIAFSFFFHRVVEKLFLGADEREGILSGIVQENVTGVRVVRAFARQKFELERFAAANTSYRDQVFKLIAWLAFYWGFSSFLGLFQLGVVLGSGLFLYTAGSITLGVLVLFLTYEQQVLWPIRQFGRILADTGKTKVALGRMAELLALATERDLDETEIVELEDGSGSSRRRDRDWAFGTIEFRNVSFSYPDGTEVLKDVSFKIRQGKHLAIVGPTGSGKSTLVHLLVRLYEPTSGRILIDGRDVRTIPKRELRRKIALVLQDGFLYGKTVRENIAIGHAEIEDSKILEAAGKAAFHSVAEGFQDGYETMVGERGVTLSGGQRQRLSLARALIRETPILVLDDSLSAVDTETDRLIREAIGKGSSDRGSSAGSAGAGTTTIIIAHRLTTLAEADHILVLEEGRVTAQGRHEDLVQQNGLYRRLAELQSAICG